MSEFDYMSDLTGIRIPILITGHVTRLITWCDWILKMNLWCLDVIHSISFTCLRISHVPPSLKPTYAYRYWPQGKIAPHIKGTIINFIRILQLFLYSSIQLRPLERKWPPVTPLGRRLWFVKKINIYFIWKMILLLK